MSSGPGIGPLSCRLAFRTGLDLGPIADRRRSEHRSVAGRRCRGEGQASRYVTTLVHWHGFAKMIPAPASSARVTAAGFHQCGWLSPVRLAFTSDDGNVDGPSSGLDDRADQHVARDIGQPEIANDHVEVTTAEDPQRFLSATGCGDVGALDTEQGTSTNRGRGGTIHS